MSPTRTTPAHLIAAALTIALTVSAVMAQPTNTVKPGPAGPGGASDALFQAGTVEFADDPFRLDSVGLSMQIPVGTQLRSSRGAGSAAKQQLLSPDGTWIVNIGTPQTTNPEATIAAAMAETIKLVKFSVGVTDRNVEKVVETQAEVLEETASVMVNGQSAGRVYISVPTGEGSKRVVKGYTFFKPSARQFVVFELAVSAEAYARVRPIYETVLATATFADPAIVTASYAAAVKNGVRLIDQLDEPDIVAAMGEKEQFHRLYKPAASGSDADATEMGYRSIRFWRGKRGEVDTERRVSDLKGADLEEGYLCQLSVRLLDGENVIDTTARYFMTPDRNSETWAVMMLRTDSKARELGKWKETGARTGTDVRVLVVEPGAKTRPVEPFIQGEGYISQFESFLLPAILMHKARTEGMEAEFGFYSYRSESETISLRRDTVTRDTQMGGAWTISTKFRDDTRPQRSVFNERGEFVRTEIPDGRVWEPIEMDRLLSIWQKKGHPTRR